ncbi:MAG: MFS transporter [Bacteroidales bacterium]
MTEAKIPQRWFVFFLFALVALTLGFFSNAIVPLKKELAELLMANSYDFSFILASRSLPGLLLLIGFIGGIILDKFGVYFTLILFSSLMLCGAFISAYAISDHFRHSGFVFNFFNSFWDTCDPAVKLMAFGFFIFGLGSLVVRVSVSKLIAVWFRGGNVTTALTLRSSSIKLGDSLAFLVSPIIFAHYGWKFPLWIGFSLILISYLILICYLIFYEKKLGKHISKSSKKKFKFSFLGKLFTKRSFLLIFFFYLVFNGVFYPFVLFGSDLLRNRYHFTGVEGGLYFSGFILSTAFLSPIMGYILDKGFSSGKLLFFGSFLFFLGMMLFMLSGLNPIIPMIALLFGVACITSSIQSLVPKLVEMELLGTAFGALNTIKNIGIYLMTLFLGFVLMYSNSDLDKELDGDLNYDSELMVVGFMSFFVFLFGFFIYKQLVKKKSAQVSNY